ncbi:TMV resistance protein N-like [Macadamia integrifolia]|uniref:TMV resistance protein N-like n=1 Tax=Macadamia integrifolia TaxID=60698 RepID=UPI001C5023E0|nr:TMV resistance protein N-like [Macadamia integrifolia]
MESEDESSKFDVFINFRGKDTRNIFVGHLYSALKRNGIRGFIDSKDLRKGEDIGKLLNIIKGSKLSIAVFSQTYIESRYGFLIDDQSNKVEEIVKDALKRLEKVRLIDVKNPVGLKSRIESVVSRLSHTSTINSKDIQFLGICGEGGMGKTTIAAAVYNRIFEDFSQSCFLEDVKERASQPNGIAGLQKDLLSDVSQVETAISNSKRGSQLIKERLQNMKILLVLDDVGNRDQLDALARDLSWFGVGSRIIITARD